MAEKQAVAPDYTQWLAAVEKVLKGKDFDRTLVSTTLDGLRIEPLYTEGPTAHDESGFPGFDPLLRGAQVAPRPDGQWDIRTRTVHPDIAVANTQILEDLAGGARSVEVLLDLGDGEGVSVRSKEDLARVLAGVDVQAAAVSLRAGAHGGTVAGWFRELHGAECEGVDPIAALVATGEADLSVPGNLASGAPASDAGASEAQEIGYILAVALHYLGETGVPPVLEVTADVDVFATVAKIRALRHCWATILANSDQPLDAARIVAVSADRWLTAVDPWVNILRGTAATLGAVVGGADSMTLVPFDSAQGLPGDLGRRLARNTQLILQDESGIGRVLDPAGGSWYIETFTDQLAAAGWKYFQRIEAAGGILEALDEVGADIAVVADRRDDLIATRRWPITGVSEFPLLDEQRPEPVAVPAPDARPPVPVNGTKATPWPRLRLADAFEELRAQAHGTVFLANLGPIAVHTARATFASNLFAAGGIRAVTGDGDIGEAFKASGAPIACICASDDVYAEQAEATAAALKAAGAKRVYLAGKGDYPGVDEYIHLGVDVLDVLTRAEAL